MSLYDIREAAVQVHHRAVELSEAMEPYQKNLEEAWSELKREIESYGEPVGDYDFDGLDPTHWEFPGDVAEQVGEGISISRYD